MTKHSITIPNRLNARTAIELSREFLIPECDECVVDFRNVTWCEPFGLLYLARILRTQIRARSERTKFSARYVENQFHGYASHMGFFRHVGFPMGNKPGEARGSSNYVPIHRWEISQVRSDAGVLAYGEHVDKKAIEICRVMLQTDEGPLFDYVQYSLREILRNAIEHSEGTEVLFCAQYWPARNCVEIGIIDDGVGLRASLSRNERLSIGTSADAVQFALLPGISGVTSHREADGEWQNSGFGLFMTSGLCGELGEFRLVSNKAGVRLSKDSREKFPARFQGTGVQMSLAVPSDEQAGRLLKSLRDRGVKQAKELNGIAKIEPSTASLMLASDFPRS